MRRSAFTFAGALVALAVLPACKGRFALPADARFVEEIALADGFGCARMKDGSLRGWGANESGQLGDGTTTARSLTVRVLGSPDGGPGQWSHVLVGGRHACALDGGGEAFCWGANAAGELGDGTREARSSPVRVAVVGAARAKDFALGDHHSCALTIAGDVICWGANDVGQLGGAAAGSPVVTGATSIAASADATCAILRDRSLRCWGSVPGRGVLPVARIEGLADVAGVGMGPNHVCAVRAWGGVACWGKDEEGELGDGAFTDRAEPVDVQGLAVPAVSVVVGRAHSCALLRNSTVHCWGANAKNQLADGTQAHRASALLVNGLFETQAISAAGDATCARFADGAARCWGGLGLPKTPGEVMPVPTEVRW